MKKNIVLTGAVQNTDLMSRLFRKDKFPNDSMGKRQESIWDDLLPH